MYYGNMMGMHGLWWVFWIAVVIALVFWGGSGTFARRDKPRETPHELLRRRLVNSEISTEEYEKRKAILDRDTHLVEKP
jgi:putative membrane protein